MLHLSMKLLSSLMVPPSLQLQCKRCVLLLLIAMSCGQSSQLRAAADTNDASDTNNNDAAVPTFTLSNNITDNTNSFSAFPAGGRDLNGQFKGKEILSMWWTSTEATESNSWMRLLNHNQCNIYLVNTNKAFGLSVRCIRN